MSIKPEQQHENLQPLLQHIQFLLKRQHLVEALSQRQDTPKQRHIAQLMQQQNLSKLQHSLNELHAADIAYILENLPLDERLVVWHLVQSEEKDGEILLEVSDPVRESLLGAMDSHEIKAAAESLDMDELADLAPDLPQDILNEIFSALDPEELAQVHSAMSYAENTVGAIMDFDVVTVRNDVELRVVLRYLRRFDQLPEHTDKIFVVDRDNQLLGLLTLEMLLTHQPDTPVADIMDKDPINFRPDDEAHAAAQAFERYDLISAPVIDSEKRLIGRLTVVDIVDYVREEDEREILSNAGLKEEEDIFASVWRSVQNRWGWLAINMCTAIFASRVIGAFENTIAHLVALATLMPIVAGMGGNSGNQTITMIVRAIAMGKVDTSAMRRLLRKEVEVALINGILWGGLLGILTWALYSNVALGLVMLAAMTLNLLLAASAGVLIPMLRIKLGKDPALGSSVMITALTDSGGFFIFLGLATLFLI
ncbi:magnesium transporter [Alkanindiges sp. WGS2144]|uniref:magnesium transporter n=1 Tax=Alkanindiges sp. WGS2144 TaxID=3366808 RepID=UPI0037522EC8